MKQKTRVSVSLLATSIFACIWFTRLWYSRAGLPYNEAGRYFDGSVVWQEQGAFIYALLSVFSFAIVVVLSYRIFREKPVTGEKNPIEPTSEWTLMELKNLVATRLDQQSYHLFSEEHARGQIFNLDAGQELGSWRCEGNVLLTSLRGCVLVSLNSLQRKLPVDSQLLVNPGTAISVRATEASSVQFIWTPPYPRVDVIKETMQA